MTRGEDLDRLAAALQRGEVVAIPTDTVYGLAVDAGSVDAAASVFALKRRPDSVALPLLVASTDQAAQLAAPEALERLEQLARSFWPGALTIVVARAAGTNLHVGGDPATIGLRCPEHPLVRELCSIVGPLATTSANRHGEQPCSSADEVRTLFGSELLVLDGGPCAGEPSTVISLVGPEPVLLRAGPVPFEVIGAALAPPRGRGPT
ncbi:MAG: threonylcarbamoyl-AMP synthase [Acidimicrobiaceae bacterium]|nr:threonylcarbamoyl-AMP synthase [Acidimicrobiaceae bacterium]